MRLCFPAGGMNFHFVYQPDRSDSSLKNNLSWLNDSLVANALSDTQ